MTPETQVVKQFGVSRGLLVGLRKRGEALLNEHWLKEGLKIVWTPAGIHWLERHFKVEVMVPDVPAIPATAMTVHRANYPNRKIIMCQHESNYVAVRVHSADNFMPGMTVKAVMDGGVWTLVGRCPRYRGRW